MNFSFSVKKAFKEAWFTLNARYGGLYTIGHKLFYRPAKGTLAEFLDIFSRTSKSHTLLQVGANDGFFHDPLYKFIKMYGWNGVLLEPQPYVFNRYLSRLHRRTPGLHVVNAALSDADGEKWIYKIAFSNARWATGLTSFNRATLEKAIASGHVERCARKYDEKLPDRSEDFIAREAIQSVSPPTLLNRYSLSAIDWLQIDAEGYDYEIIKLMDVGRTQPRVIAYEHSHLASDDRHACEVHLRLLGYAITHIHENTVAMRGSLENFERFFPAAK